MKLYHLLTVLMVLGVFSGRAEVPEILELVPGAGGYELIAKLNPLEWGARGYQMDRSSQITGKLKRVAYLLKLTGKDGQKSWVFAAMDPFSKDLGCVLVPTENSPAYLAFLPHAMAGM